MGTLLLNGQRGVLFMSPGAPSPRAHIGTYRQVASPQHFRAMLSIPEPQIRLAGQISPPGAEPLLMLPLAWGWGPEKAGGGVRP